MGLQVDPVSRRRVLALAFAALVALPGAAAAQNLQQPLSSTLADLCAHFPADPNAPSPATTCPFLLAPADASLFGGLLPGQPSLFSSDPLGDQARITVPVAVDSILDPDPDIVSLVMTVLAPEQVPAFGSALAALPGAAGTVTPAPTNGDLVIDVRFAIDAGAIPTLYLITASGATVPASFNTIDPMAPPSGVTATELVAADPATGQLLPAPGVAVAPTRAGVVVVVDIGAVEQPAETVAIAARTPPGAPATPGRSASFDSAFGRLADIVGSDEELLLLLLWAGVQDPGEALLINFLLASCEPPATTLAVQPDGKPPVAGHPTPAIAATCAVTTAPTTTVTGPGVAAPGGGICTDGSVPPPAGLSVYCGGLPIPPDAPRTLILVAFDQPFDLFNGTNGVFGAPILDVNPAGNSGAGFKARKGFPFDTLQGSKSYLKVIGNAKGELGLHSLDPRRFAPKNIAGFAAFGPSWVLWDVPGSPTAAYLPVVEMNTLTSKTSAETVVAAGSLGGVPAEDGPARLLPMYFTPPVIPLTPGAANGTQGAP